MYNDEWEPVMTADSMEEKVREFARLAQKRADEQDKDIDDVVHNLTHDSYLMKHTTGDVLRELQELDDAYPDAFYNGAANEHLMEYAEQDVNFEFWYDYLYMFLAAGLEWAVLEEVKEPAANVDS
jgi:hypothetical protein